MPLSSVLPVAFGSCGIIFFSPDCGVIVASAAAEWTPEATSYYQINEKPFVSIEKFVKQSAWTLTSAAADFRLLCNLGLLVGIRAYKLVAMIAAAVLRVSPTV